jgi:hypothetical protein
MASVHRKSIVVGFLIGSILTGSAALTYKYRATFKKWFSSTAPAVIPTNPYEGSVGKGGGPTNNFRWPTPPWKATPDNIEVVAVDAPLTIAIDRTVLKDGTLDPATISTQNVGLVDTASGSLVPSSVKLNDARDAIVVTPNAPLKPAANYMLHLGNGVKLADGTPMDGYVSAFYTKVPDDVAKTIRFEAVPQQKIVGFGGASSLHFGPDGKLYAGLVTGEIIRYAVNPDGTLGASERLPGVTAAHGKARFVAFVFDPKSTPDNLIIYASHTPLIGTTGRPLTSVANWSAVISRLSGPKLEKVEDVVVNLPRSFIDHQTFEPVWGPDGALYFHQGAQNAFGYPDEIWGWRGETPLSASVLRLDVSKWTPGTPIDVKTMDGGGTYDPAAPGAPLTVYASGIRVAYNIRFHSNGHLYGGINGSSAYGNTPAGPGTPPIPQIPMIEHDWLFDIRKGAYYGHPNPSQGHFAFNGANPTPGIDPFEVPFYPVGTQPDSQWRKPIMDVGRNISSNGMLEYQNADAFGGKLKGKLVLCRYNVGSDLIFVGVDGPDGTVSSVWTQVDGAKDLKNPLAIVEDPKTGNLYVSEFDPGVQRITLLRPAK